VDSRERLGEILKGLNMVGTKFSMPVIFPVHPRTRKMVKEFGLGFDGIQAIEPVGFLEFLQLEASARLVLTDSGGVQEEACVLGVPCVMLRDNTERLETVDVGANVLAGVRAIEILKATKQMLSQGDVWENPFGDGRASDLILDFIA